MRLSKRNLVMFRTILQRQFFEAIVRAASIKYANSNEFSTLSEKLDHLFKKNLMPLAGKNKAKSAEDDVSKSSMHVRIS